MGKEKVKIKRNQVENILEKITQFVSIKNDINCNCDCQFLKSLEYSNHCTWFEEDLYWKPSCKNLKVLFLRCDKCIEMFEIGE